MTDADTPATPADESGRLPLGRDLLFLLLLSAVALAVPAIVVLTSDARNGPSNNQFGPAVAFEDRGAFEVPVEQVATTVVAEADLPRPGEQPDDVDAARGEVEDAFVLGLGSELPLDERAAFHEVPELWLDRQTALEDSGQFDGQLSDANVFVVTVVFTAPDLAVVLFAIEGDGNATIGPQAGNALLIDGTWRVSDEASCTLQALAGFC